MVLPSMVEAEKFSDHPCMCGNSFVFKFTSSSGSSVKCEIATWRDRVISVFASGFCMTNTVALSLKLGWMVTYRHTNSILSVFFCVC